MTTPLSSAACQFITHNQHAFRHDTIGSMFVHRTIVTSLFVRYSVAATPAGRLRHENVTRWHECGEGSDWERRTFQSPSYILYTVLGRQPRGSHSGQTPNSIPWKGNRAATDWRHHRQQRSGELPSKHPTASRKGHRRRGQVWQPLSLWAVASYLDSGVSGYSELVGAHRCSYSY